MRLLKNQILNYFASSLALALLLVSCSKAQNKYDASRGLKTVADFSIGTAIQIKKLLNDPKLKQLEIENFNSITSDRDMKMNRITPSEGVYNWGTIDSILQFAQENKQRLFGHNLIWHSSTPEWVETKGAKDTVWLAKFMKEYIQMYVGRYKGKVAAWDVVNEGFETQGGEYRKTFWYNNLGKSYIEKAFIYAHEIDPKAILFYNDFNIERDSLKLNAVLEMVKEFKQKGVPISGIGFQMHIRMDTPDELIAKSLEKAAATGLQIHLSEVDIIFNKHDDTKGGGVQIHKEITEEMKKAQAEKYKNLVLMYRKIVPKAQQFGITFWNFNDRDTWINGFFNLTDWPTIFDDKLSPKPAYFGFKEGLEQEIK
jgi:endo-1,4-beta-xylanase